MHKVERKPTYQDADAHDEEHEDDQPRPLALPCLRRLQHDDARAEIHLEVEQLAEFWGRLHPGRKSHSSRRGFLDEG